MPVGACVYDIRVLTTDCTIVHRTLYPLQLLTALTSHLSTSDVVTTIQEHLLDILEIESPIPYRGWVVDTVTRIRTSTYRRTVRTPFNGLLVRRNGSYVASTCESDHRGDLSYPRSIDLRYRLHRRTFRIDTFHGTDGHGFVIPKYHQSACDLLIGVFDTDGIDTTCEVQIRIPDIAHGPQSEHRFEDRVYPFTQM